MEIDAFFLADHVAVTAGGKFYVSGGGFTRAEVPELPSQLPIGVLVRIRVDEAEGDKELRLKVTLIGPSGKPNVAPMEGIAAPLTDYPDPLEGEENVLHMGVMIHAAILREGMYRMELELEEEFLRRIAFPVVLRPDKVLPETA